MARAPSSQADVLNAVVSRLLESIEELTTAMCMVTFDPEPPPGISKGVFLLISPMEGTFDSEVFTGSAQHVVIEQTGIVVTTYLTYKGRAGVHDGDLLDPRRGLLEWKRRILRALAGHDLGAGRDEPLTTLLEPLQSGRPELSADGRHVSLMITFSTDIHWELED